MQQASHISGYSAFRRAAQVIIVMLALATMVFASCMMVNAGQELASFTQSEQGVDKPLPGPTAPEPAT